MERDDLRGKTAGKQESQIMRMYGLVFRLRMSDVTLSSGR